MKTALNRFGVNQMPLLLRTSGDDPCEARTMMARLKKRGEASSPLGFQVHSHPHQSNDLVQSSSESFAQSCCEFFFARICTLALRLKVQTKSSSILKTQKQSKETRQIPGSDFFVANLRVKQKKPHFHQTMNRATHPNIRFKWQQ